jgi:hypothetical protein
MKSAIIYDIKRSFYFTGDTLPLRYKTQPVNAIFTAVIIKNAVLLDVMPYGCCNYRRFRENYHLHQHDERIGELPKVVPTSPILVTLMMEVISFFKTSVITRTTRFNIPEDGILHSHRR